jgi:hypothetical protein
MVFSHPDLTSYSYWGGLVCGPMSLVYAACTVREIKRTRNSVRSDTTEGRVLSALGSATNSFGDVTAKKIDVRFTTANGTRITFPETVNDTYAAGQKVTVHYDPRHPRDTATVLTPRTALSRVLGYGTLTVAFLIPFVAVLFFNLH